MRAGGLDRRISIYKFTTEQDPVTLEARTVKVLHKKMWAGKDSKASKDTLQTNKVINVGDEVFLTRYDNSILPSMQVLYDGKYYDIKGIEDTGNRYDGMRIITQRTY